MRITAFAFTLIALGAINAESAITEAQAKANAHQYILAVQTAIQNRVLTCVTENPRLCHTGWAASVTANTDPSDIDLANQIFDDLGYKTTDRCGDFFPGTGTFSGAGIAIPAQAPANVRITIMKNKQGWGVLVEARIRYDGQLYQRGYGAGIASGYDWTGVEG